MASGEFLGRAYIEQIERARVALSPERFKLRGVDALHAEAGRDPRGGFAGARQAGRARGARLCGGAAPGLEASEDPGRRPVLQRDDGIGNPALRSACAPMIARVRPAQLMTTGVSGEGTASNAR